MFEVQTWTFIDGWVNCWTTTNEEGEEIPEIYPTQAAAEQALAEFLEEVHEAVLAGDMIEDYDPDDYRVMEVKGDVKQ